MLIIGVTGGIGSGKTTVCDFFEYLKVPVYYSDYWAKELMVSSQEVVIKIKAALGENSYNVDGSLNRAHISSVVFNDKLKLQELNNIVHPAVYSHFLDFVALKTLENPHYIIIESAILIEIGWGNRVDKTVVVTADKDTRICRVVNRDKISVDEVIRRMDNQIDDNLRKNFADYIIDTDDSELLIPKIISLHNEFLSL